MFFLSIERWRCTQTLRLLKRTFDTQTPECNSYEPPLARYSSLKVSITGWKPVRNGKTDTTRRCRAFPFFGWDKVIFNISPSKALPADAAAKGWVLAKSKNSSAEQPNKTLAALSNIITTTTLFSVAIDIRTRKRRLEPEEAELKLQFLQKGIEEDEEEELGIWVFGEGSGRVFSHIEQTV